MLADCGPKVQFLPLSRPDSPIGEDWVWLAWPRLTRRLPESGRLPRRIQWCRHSGRLRRPWRCTRLADDQFRWQYLAFGNLLRVFDIDQEHLDCRTPQLLQRLAHGRQRWMNQGRLGNAVEAHDGDIVWNLQAERADGLDNA